jgi:hypothetical protein
MEYLPGYFGVFVFVWKMVVIRGDPFKHDGAI